MKTIITVIKVSELGRKSFFKVEKEGHHTDSVDVHEVARSLALHYRPPFFEVSITLVETTETTIDMDDL